MSRPRRIRYCPGDSVGSPATLPLNHARYQLAVDRSYCALMLHAGEPITHPPHIGGTCPKCRRPPRIH